VLQLELGNDHLTWKDENLNFLPYVEWDRFVRDRPFNLKGEGLWHFEFLSRYARIFFPEFIIRLYDKNSESDYFIFLHRNRAELIHIWISMPNMENFYYDFTAIDPNKEISKTRQMHVQ
jgi:hypothetical protein